jgi:nitrogen fixation protein FixH
MTTPFTGRRMAFAMIAFFGVVIGVNMLMAVVAARSFGGTVVDNSYVASQRFNRWLAQPDAQRANGWTAMVERKDEGVAVVFADHGAPLVGGAVEGIAVHPLGRMPDRRLSFQEIAPGRYRSIESLPAGRWRLRIILRHGGRAGRFMEDIAA